MIAGNGRSNSLPKTADVVVLGAGVMGVDLSILPNARRETSLSPAVGLVMSELVLDGKCQTADITAFPPNRFVENQPIETEYEYADD